MKRWTLRIAPFLFFKKNPTDLVLLQYIATNHFILTSGFFSSNYPIHVQFVDHSQAVSLKVSNTCSPFFWVCRKLVVFIDGCFISEEKKHREESTTADESSADETHLAGKPEVISPDVTSKEVKAVGNAPAASETAMGRKRSLSKSSDKSKHIKLLVHLTG